MKTVVMTVKVKLALKNVEACLHSAAELFDADSVIETHSPTVTALNDLCSATVLATAVQLVPDAIEAHLMDRIAESRGSSFLGIGFETDESPPCGRILAGLRFQITIAYVCFALPEVDWAKAAEPPIQSEAYLCDILNAPNKDGATVAKIVAQQLGRIGCTLADIVSGTSDGGGENEGRFGVHALLEDHSPMYVRRRGLEHLSWNFCSAGLAAADPIGRTLKHLVAYLREGVTWHRLKEIATSSVARQGFHHCCIAIATT